MKYLNVFLIQVFWVLLNSDLGRCQELPYAHWFKPPSQPIPLVHPIGERRILVLLVGFTDFPPPCSQAELSELVFGNDPSSVASVYFTNSYGQVQITGEVIGPLIPGSSEQMCGREFDSKVLSYAAEQGINTDFSRIVYVHPAIPNGGTNCSSGGGGTLDGGLTGRADVGGCNRETFLHELGHTFGMGHASVGCPPFDTLAEEYGDLSCLMGISDTFSNLNAPHRFQMGWLSPSKTSAITQGGDYPLAEYSLAPNNAVAPQLYGVPSLSGAEPVFLSYFLGEPRSSSVRYKLFMDKLFVHTFEPYTDLGQGRFRKLSTCLLGKLDQGDQFSTPDGINIHFVSRNDGAISIRVTFPVAYEIGCNIAAIKELLPTARMSLPDRGKRHRKSGMRRKPILKARKAVLDHINKVGSLVSLSPAEASSALSLNIKKVRQIRSRIVGINKVATRIATRRWRRFHSGIYSMVLPLPCFR